MGVELDEDSIRTHKARTSKNTIQRAPKEILGDLTSCQARMRKDLPSLVNRFGKTPNAMASEASRPLSLGLAKDGCADKTDTCSRRYC